MNNLLNTVVQQAQTIVNAKGLPDSGNIPRQHAQTFISTTAPQIEKEAENVNTFISLYQSQQSAATSAINSWMAGDDKERVKVQKLVQKLSASLSIAEQAMNTGNDQVNSFRTQTFSDQQALTQAVNSLQGQINQQKAIIDRKHAKLAKTQKMITILRFNPLAWAIAELANVISNSKSIEQEILEQNRTLAKLSQNINSLNQVLAITRNFQDSIEVMVNSVGNLVNMISITKGRLDQIESSINTSKEAAGAVIVQAYYSSMSQQITSLAATLGMPQLAKVAA